MTDLTVLVAPVLVSPIPFPSQKPGFRTGRPVSRSNTVSLEFDVDSEADTPGLSPPSDRSSTPSSSSPPSTTANQALPSPGFLSPPVNTWKSNSRSRPRRSRHRVTRSQSAPPGRTSFSSEDQEVDNSLLSADPVRPIPKRSTTAFTPGSSTRGGELIRPPPPLLRPTTFWRKTQRSGVTGASYSPSSHLIRRSTFIAAGLAFDAPVHDLSALCVESRVGFIVVPPDQELQ